MQTKRALSDVKLKKISLPFKFQNKGRHFLYFTINKTSTQFKFSYIILIYGQYLSIFTSVCILFFLFQWRKTSQSKTHLFCDFLFRFMSWKINPKMKQFLTNLCYDYVIFRTNFSYTKAYHNVVLNVTVKL